MQAKTHHIMSEPLLPNNVFDDINKRIALFIVINMISGLALSHAPILDVIHMMKLIYPGQEATALDAPQHTPLIHSINYDAQLICAWLIGLHWFVAHYLRKGIASRPRAGQIKTKSVAYLLIGSIGMMLITSLCATHITPATTKSRSVLIAYLLNNGPVPTSILVSMLVFMFDLFFIFFLFSIRQIYMKWRG